MPQEDVTFQPLGDMGVRVQFGTTIAPETNARIRQFCLALERDSVRGVVEWVPAYATVAVYYQPWLVRYREICASLEERLIQSEREALPPARTVLIPVRYGGLDGPDLADVAACHGLTTGEVIALHTEPTYLVYMLGFMPGFPYLGGLPERLVTPRLDTPRQSVPAGSVGIGGAQTGIYPVETPGGWRIIGRTPLRLFDIDRDPRALLGAGDLVRFVAEDTDAAD